VSVRIPSRPKLSASVPQGSAHRVGDGIARGRTSSNPSSRRSLTNPPVAGGKAAYTSAFHPPRTEDKTRGTNWAERRWRSVNSPATGRPHDGATGDGASPSGQARALVSTSVGVVGTGRGEQVVSGVKPAYLPNFRFPPPDSGVMPFSEVRGRQLRAIPEPLVASGYRSEASSRFQSSPVLKGSNPSTWGRNGFLSRPCLRD